MNVIGAGSTILLAEPPLFKPHLDPTLVLHPGDHPFGHESAVHYSTARWFRVEALMAAMKDGKCHLKKTMSAKLLERTHRGLLDSPFTVNALRDECQRLFGRGGESSSAATPPRKE